MEWQSHSVLSAGTVWNARLVPTVLGRCTRTVILQQHFLQQQIMAVGSGVVSRVKRVKSMV